MVVNLASAIFAKILIALILSILVVIRGDKIENYIEARYFAKPMPTIIDAQPDYVRQGVKHEYLHCNQMD